MTKFSYVRIYVRIINTPPSQSDCWVPSAMDKTCGTTERIIAIDKNLYLLSNGFYYDKQCFEELPSLFSPNKQKIKINLSGK